MHRADDLRATARQIQERTVPQSDHWQRLALDDLRGEVKILENVDQLGHRCLPE